MAIDHALKAWHQRTMAKGGEVRMQEGGDPMQEMFTGTPPSDMELGPIGQGLREAGGQFVENIREAVVDPAAFHKRALGNIARRLEEDPESFAMDWTGGGLGGVIKPKGGQWLADQVEELLSPIEKKLPWPQSQLEEMPQVKMAHEKDLALNKFIQGPMTRYIKNEMASPDDPLRKIADENYKRAEKQYEAAKRRVQKEFDRVEKLKAEGPKPNMPPGTFENAVEQQKGRAERMAAEVQETFERQVENALPFRVGEQANWQVEQAISSREKAGFPVKGMAETPAGKSYESFADRLMRPTTAGEITGPNYFLDPSFGRKIAERNPWLTRVDPSTPVYHPSTGTFPDQVRNFRHIVDELENAMNPDSGLPPSLLLTPEQVASMGMEKAARHVVDINLWRAEQKAAADAVRAQKAAVVYKEYPESDKGLKWVELKAGEYPKELPSGFEIVNTSPRAISVKRIGDDGRGAIITGLDINDVVKGIYKHYPDTPGNPRKELEDALKYEGEVMSHCVGRYCEDVETGASRIFSLRDAKGKPHATIEVKTPENINYQSFWDSLTDAERARLTPEINQKAIEIVEDVKNRPEIAQYGKDVIKNVAWKESVESLPQFKDYIAKPPLRIEQIKGFNNRKPKDEYIPYIQDFVKSQKWSQILDIENADLIDIRNTRKVLDILGGNDVGKVKQVQQAIDGNFATRKEIEAFKEGKAIGGEVRMAEGGAVSAEVLGGGTGIPYKKGGKVKKKKGADLDLQAWYESTKVKDNRTRFVSAAAPANPQVTAPPEKKMAEGGAVTDPYQSQQATQARRAQDINAYKEGKIGADELVKHFPGMTAAMVEAQVGERQMKEGGEVRMQVGGDLHEETRRQLQAGVPVQGPIAEQIIREEREGRERQAQDRARRVSELPLKEKLGGGYEAFRTIQSILGQEMLKPVVGLFGGKKKIEELEEGTPLPESEAGIEYLTRFGNVLSPVGKAIEAAKIPDVPILPEALSLTYVPGVGRQVAGMAEKAQSRLAQMPKGTGNAVESASGQIGDQIPARVYETRQDGPFFRVNPEGLKGIGAKDRGIKEEVSAETPGGPTGGDLSQRISDEDVATVLKDPNNFVRQSASRYSQEHLGHEYVLPEMPPSSLAKQSAVGRVFDLAAQDDPQYKKAIFNAYGRQYPQLIEQSGAKNYDQLVEAAYRQLAKETKQQFELLPINMSFHRKGEGNYSSSNQMLQDVFKNRHLYVFQGGDPHPFLNAVDPNTGLNTNEMFRAVHDFYGHAVHGNQFGPKGEEIAYAAHSQMFSPLARLAMATETRGQNSFVNYTPVNAKLKAAMNEWQSIKYEAQRKGDKASAAEAENQISKLFENFEFAPQRSLILPPEFLQTNYKGGMPDYLQSLIKPQPGTSRSEFLTHYSQEPSLEMLDPKQYGTGIAGEEAGRLDYTLNPARERTYFYTGDPSQVRPEVGLGPYRYGAMGENLYDIAEDPASLGLIAREANRIPYTAVANKGLVEGLQAVTDLERMVKEYGYEGLINPERGVGLKFTPTPAKRFAKGGQVKRDHDLMAWAKEQKMVKGGIARVTKAAEKAADKASQSFVQDAANRLKTKLADDAIKNNTKPIASEKVIENTIAKSAENIAKKNPKLSDEEIAKRAEREAAAKLKWERAQKPTLEKQYGELEKAAFNEPLQKRQRNVPGVVEERIRKAEEFLSQPTEPWEPPPIERQAFDRSLIKEALEGFPGIEQTRFPRYNPARADLSYIEEIYGDPRNRALIEKQIKRGLPLGGETFYASLYPVKVAALERGIPARKFEQFIYETAPASARNSILNEMAVGQFLRDMKARGLPLDEKTVSQEMAKFKEKYGVGLSLMPRHREGVKAVIEGPVNLREQVIADIPTNYKVPTYGTQKAGDFGKSMVLDVHESAGQTMGSRYHPYFTEQGGFGSTEYGLAESKMLDIAESMGLPGGMAQAGRWFGGGELTGLKSPRGDALDLLEKQAAYTLHGMGIKPTREAVRNYVLNMIDTGEGILMPYFKSTPLPDVRTKKDGGLIKKRQKSGLSYLNKD